MNFFRKICQKKSWERQESNPGLLGVKRKCYLCAMLPPLTYSLSLTVNIVGCFFNQLRLEKDCLSFSVTLTEIVGQAIAAVSWIHDFASNQRNSR